MGVKLYVRQADPPIYDLAPQALCVWIKDIILTVAFWIGAVFITIKGAMGEDIDSLFISGGSRGERKPNQPIRCG